MKKFVSLVICLVIFLTLFSGCKKSENSVNRLLFDTAVTLTARCDRSVLLEAVQLCENYENLLSRTKQGSDVYKINNSSDFVQVSEETVLIIKTALEFCEKTNGEYDITITPVATLWDFNKEILPDAAELSQAVKKVDYRLIQVEGNRVNANGTQIDLGSVAKGYIADKIKEFFISRGVSDAIINLGGNVYVLGDEYTSVGVQKPFSQGVAGVIKMKNASAVTSGTYQRCFTKGGTLYHHILDPKTGYPKENDLDSVTVMGESSMLCDIMSTVCLLSGGEKAEELIKEEGLSAVLIRKNGQITTVGDIDFKKH